jgi:hypothetical protein
VRSFNSHDGRQTIAIPLAMPGGARRLAVIVALESLPRCRLRAEGFRCKHLATDCIRDAILGIPERAPSTGIDQNLAGGMAGYRTVRRRTARHGGSVVSRASRRLSRSAGY